MRRRTRRSLVPLITTTGVVVTRTIGTTPAAGSGDRAETLMRGIVAAVAGDSSLVGELYTDDVSGWSPSGSVSSAAELAIEIEDDEAAFSDVELTFAALDVGGEMACVEWEMRATQTGPLVIDDDLQIEATGIRLRVRGVAVAEFEGDRIRDLRQYWDDAELLAQVGTVPDD